jgi:hypothetical protein
MSRVTIGVTKLPEPNRIDPVGLKGYDSPQSMSIYEILQVQSELASALRSTMKSWVKSKLHKNGTIFKIMQWVVAVLLMGLSWIISLLSKLRELLEFLSVDSSNFVENWCEWIGCDEDVSNEAIVVDKTELLKLLLIKFVQFFMMK